MSYEGSFNENFPEQNFHSFQFFKYQSFEGRTATNFPRLFYGNIREAKNITRLNKYFKENGFITDCCSRLQKLFIIQHFLNFMIIKCYYVILMHQDIQK